MRQAEVMTVENIGEMPSPGKLFLTIAICIFVAEALVMVILHLFPPIPHVFEVVVDAGALVFLISPALYIFLFRPLVLQLRDRLIMEQELRKARAEAERISNTKGIFLANMSHEIRTPMSGIIGMADILDKTQLVSEQKKYLQMIKSSANDLLMIINDILDFSKIEAGKYEVEKIKFKLRESLQNLIETFVIKAQGKNLKFTGCICPDVPEYLIGDPGRLRQILGNLLGNAVKYTEQGEISLEIRRVKPEQGDTLLHFTVSDSGIGIPFAKQETIFQPFVQADKSIARKYGGTGLGLAICSQLVKLMNGRIWLESRVGKGSVFHVSLPFGIQSEEEKAALLLRGESLQNLAVLVVNDNAINQFILRELLKGWRMEPTVVADDLEALKIIAQNKKAGKCFSLVIFNDHMTNMDGFTFAGKLKELPGLADTKLLMLLSLSASEVRCRHLGIDGFVRQPLKKSELLNVITNIFSDYAPQKPAESKNLQPNINKNEGIPNPPPDKDFPTAINRPLRILLVEDTPVNQEIAVILLNKQGHSVRVANNGMEALSALGSAPFDLILMDVQMPVMGGYEATAAIRRRELDTGRHIPIIAMTAHALKDDKEQCLQAGMDDYVSKPISAESLFQAVERAWPLIKGKDKMTKEEKMAGFIKNADGVPLDSPDQEKHFDEDVLMGRLGGRADLLKKIVKLFIDNAPHMLSEIREAIVKKDAQALDDAAHAFKGAVSTFAAASAYETAKELETIGRSGNLSQAETMFGDLEKEVDLLKPALSKFVRSQTGE
ncbi:MAG: response regulator [Candidatus Schekmanbacteria bacterium]|nr:response regulator [Candidatus Schekmanbacteria bacterium]